MFPESWFWNFGFHCHVIINQQLKFSWPLYVFGYFFLLYPFLAIYIPTALHPFLVSRAKISRLYDTNSKMVSIVFSPAKTAISKLGISWAFLYMHLLYLFFSSMFNKQFPVKDHLKKLDIVPSYGPACNADKYRGRLITSLKLFLHAAA